MELIKCSLCKKSLKDCACLHIHTDIEYKKAPRCCICCTKATTYYTPDGNRIICQECYYKIRRGD